MLVPCENVTVYISSFATRRHFYHVSAYMLRNATADRSVDIHWTAIVCQAL